MVLWLIGSTLVLENGYMWKPLITSTSSIFLVCKTHFTTHIRKNSSRNQTNRRMMKSNYLFGIKERVQYGLWEISIFHGKVRGRMQTSLLSKVHHTEVHAAANILLGLAIKKKKPTGKAIEIWEIPKALCNVVTSHSILPPLFIQTVVESVAEWVPALSPWAAEQLSVTCKPHSLDTS